MGLLLILVIVGGLFLIAPAFIPSRLTNSVINWGLRAVGALVILFGIGATSFVIIPDGNFGTMFKTFGGGSLSNGRIVAVNGENGPQGEVLTPGFHLIPLVNLLNNVNENNEETTIEPGKVGVLAAKDGDPLPAGQTFADPFPAELGNLMLDPKTFMDNHGFKGPQLTVLSPGRYRINPYLWNVTIEDAKSIDVGYVGVVKSNVFAAVDFNSLKSDKPSDCAVIKHVISVKAEQGSQALDAPTVPVGCIGTWDKPLQPGLYYFNPRAFSVTDVDTRAQVWNYAGGYTRSTISLTVDEKGQIVQERTNDKVAESESDADQAINVTMEGWDIPLELRVIAQVSPDEASCVVAGVGTLAEVEDRVLTPSIRAITRDVAGGTYQVTEPQLDEGGKEVLDEDGKPKMITINRQAKALDLLYQRPLIEGEIERRIRPEAEKSCVTIREVRLGQPVMPPELLLPGKRTQLATQLAETYKQEQLAQEQRSLSEKARATADQQTTLVTAEISVQASVQNAIASENIGIGQQKQLEAIAIGQQAQKDVLGPDATVQLRMFESALDFLKDNPEVLEAALTNAQKFVPSVLINGSQGQGSDVTALLQGILGQTLTANANGQAPTSPAVAIAQ